MRKNEKNEGSKSDEGLALVVVLLVMAAFFAILLAILFVSRTEKVVAVNEQDYQKAMGYAEAGLSWAQRRAFDLGGGGFSEVLNGPDNAGAGDDNLLGLRDLSLTSTGQFTNANEATKSAIVTKDLGTGSKKWEVVRFADSGNIKALVYVRADDNYDDDSTDPSNNDPLQDTDREIRLTSAVEYPVFVDGSGAEVPNTIVERGRAVRMLTETISSGDAPDAILAGGNVTMTGGLKVCGACGSFHTNGDVNITNPPAICDDATASGTWTQSGTPVIGGDQGGGYPTKTLPIINPYSPDFTPTPGVFDTSGSSILPAELKCGSSTAKYFALVADSNKGKVFKAYWDSGNSRWKWKLIDDLSDGTDVALDDCGRAPGDSGYASGISDGQNDEFYEWKPNVDATSACTACGLSGSDTSLCSISNNDYVGNAYYDATSGSKIASIAGSSCPALPGGYPGDGTADFNAAARATGGLWSNGGTKVYSPLYNAVLFFYGGAKMTNNIGNGQYCRAAGCIAAPPDNIWRVSIISYGDIIVTNSPHWGPPTAGATSFSMQLIAGRDVQITGSPTPGTSSCASGCSSTTPASISAWAGIIAAHEQIEITGSPSIFGPIIAEHAVACSATVNPASNFTGSFNLYYDCAHPPYPWSSANRIIDWSELP